MNNTTHPRTTRPINNRMPMRQGPGAGYGVSVDTPKHENVVLRREIGEVLRGVRQHQGRTLREVSSQARVSLGYLSEVERGQKEASSEILASVAEALDVPISTIMREVGDRLSVLEGLQSFPDVVPDELVASVDAELSLR